MQVTAVQYGGNPVDGLNAVFGDASKLKDFIINGANFGKNSVGAPISMRVEYLYNNALAKISNATKYDVTERIAIPKSKTNIVGVDVVSLVGGSIEGTKYVDANSYCEIREIKVFRIDKDGNEVRTKTIPVLQPKRYNRNGFEEPVYKIVPLGELGENIPIGTSILVKATVDMSIRTRDSREHSVNDEVDNVVLAQTFTYTSSGWTASYATSTKQNPFFNISKTVQFPKNGAHCTIDLNFRFLIDGLEVAK